MANVYNDTNKVYVESANTDLYPTEEGWTYSPNIDDAYYVTDIQRGSYIIIPSVYWSIIRVVEGIAVIFADKQAYFEDQVRSEVTVAYNSEIENGKIEMDGIEYDTQLLDNSDLLATYILSELKEGSLEVEWIAADGEKVYLSTGDFKRLVEYYLTRMDFIKTAYAQKLAEISELSWEELAEYDVTANWPE